MLFRSEDWKGGRVEMFELRKGVGKGEMARVVYGGMRGEDAVVAREDCVLIYDLRVRSFSHEASNELLTIPAVSTRFNTSRRRSYALSRYPPRAKPIPLPRHLSPHSFPLNTSS